MDTLGHTIWTYVLFRRRRDVVYLAAGALAPDLWLWSVGFTKVLTGGMGALARKGVAWLMRDPLAFWGDRLSHSIPLWAAVLIAALVGRFRSVAAVAAGALLHIAVDLVSHRRFGQAYLYPLWREPIRGLFESTSGWFVATDLAFMVGLLFFWLRRRGKMKSGDGYD